MLPLALKAPTIYGDVNPEDRGMRMPSETRHFRPLLAVEASPGVLMPPGSCPTVEDQALHRQELRIPISPEGHRTGPIVVAT
jgi:hypothetical protein